MKNSLILLTIVILLISCGPEKVTIGTQVWMTQNLNVDTYRNGDAIPQVTNEKEWESLTTGAWCYYNNDATNDTIYGKLYNWYAVNDSRGLAPKGWHVPTDEEWKILKNMLGGEDIAGVKMKTTGTTRWASPNRYATNESGYTGLPAGSRGYSGAFDDINYYGYWWSASDANSSDAFLRLLGYGDGDLSRHYSNKRNGFSVRCLRD